MPEGGFFVEIEFSVEGEEEDQQEHLYLIAADRNPDQVSVFICLEADVVPQRIPREPRQRCGYYNESVSRRCELSEEAEVQEIVKEHDYGEQHILPEDPLFLLEKNRLHVFRIRIIRAIQRSINGQPVRGLGV